MAKALVIKNADFSANRVTTVTFNDVPCTGLSFASDTITITGYTPVEVQYTLTPSNTTDEVIWTSSDTSVVTVDDGELTVVGIGTSVLTAECGIYKATATVSVNIAYIPNYMWCEANKSNNHINANTNYSRLAVLGYGNQKVDYAFNSSNSELLNTFYPILLPNNTAYVKVSYDTSKASMIYNSNANLFTDLFANEPSPDSGYGNTIYALGTLSAKNLRNDGFEIFEIPNGVDAVVFTVRTQQTYDASTSANSIAESLGLTIEFLRDSE